MKQFLKDYFSFSTKEKHATILLVIVMLAFILIPYVYKAKREKITIDAHTQANLQALQNLQIKQAAANNYIQANKVFSAKTENSIFKPFYFDPNTVDANGWQQLGLRDKTIQTILNYRSKGGRFKQPTDIKKIWGLRSDEADRIIPYIKIAETTNRNATYQNNAFNNTANTHKLAPVDINTATPEMLKHLPGISDGLHYRIIKYREKLGGFISIEQVKETYGITDSAFSLIQPYLQLKTNELLKLNINAASEFELNAHPYIDRSVAKAIVMYRQQHGNYSSINDLKKIVFIKDAFIQRVGMYLTVN